MATLNDRFLLTIALSICIFVVNADEILLKDEAVDRGAHSDRSGLWFGPRLGKRSSPLISNDRDILQRLLEAAANLKYESDIYERDTDKEPDRRNPWTGNIPSGFFTPRPGRSQKVKQEPRRRYNSVDFTPRLGRAFDDMMSDEELERYYAVRDTRREFTPRLGRDVSGYSNKNREVRSVNLTQS